MRYNYNIFVNQYPVVVNFIQHLAYYRAIKSAYDRLAMPSPFWTATIDAHIMIASVSWCKFYGPRANPIDWTKTPVVDVQKLQGLFRAQLLSDVGLHEQQWTDYHKSVCDFRDKYVAHHDISFSAIVPDFDIALKVAYVYETWIRCLLKPDTLDDQPLKTYFEQCLFEACAVTESAMSA